MALCGFHPSAWSPRWAFFWTGWAAHFPATCQCSLCHRGLLLLLSTAKEKCACFEQELIEVNSRGEEAKPRIQVETFTVSTVTNFVLMPRALMSSMATTPHPPIFSIRVFMLHLLGMDSVSLPQSKSLPSSVRHYWGTIDSMETPEPLNFLLWKRNSFNLVHFSLVHSHEPFLGTTKGYREEWHGPWLKELMRSSTCLCVCVCDGMMNNYKWDGMCPVLGRSVGQWGSPGEGHRCLTLGVEPGVGKGWMNMRFAFRKKKITLIALVTAVPE